MVMRRDARTFGPAEVVSGVRAQWRSLGPVMLLIYAPVALAFAIVVAIRLRTGIAIAEFTRDPLAFTDIPVYKGVLSNLGAVVWSATAGICLFTYALIRSRGAGGAGSYFLLAGGLLTVLLLLDDLFMLHEVVFPEHLGVPQPAVYATYIVLLLWFLVWFRSTIVQTGFLLLALALAGFGVSVGVDRSASIVPYPGLYVFEDGAKLVGIVSWAAYFVLVSARRLLAELGEGAATAPRARDIERGAVGVG